MIGQRERKLLFRKRLTTAVLALLFIAIAIIPSMRSIVLQALQPFLSQIQRIGANWREQQAEQQTLADAKAEIDRLHALSTNLIFDRTEYERLKRENIALREMVRYEAPEKFRTLPCGIVAFDIALERKLATLDCGTSSGIAKDNAVLTPSGILIGTVHEVFSDHAVLQLLKDPMSKVAGEVSGLSDSQGIVMAVGGGAVALRYLGENVRVEPSSIVQTAGLLEQIPAGIPLGTIDSTVKESDTPFQRAILMTPIDPTTLTLVHVLISV